MRGTRGYKMSQTAGTLTMLSGWVSSAAPMPPWHTPHDQLSSSSSSSNYHILLGVLHCTVNRLISPGVIMTVATLATHLTSSHETKIRLRCLISSNSQDWDFKTQYRDIPKNISRQRPSRATVHPYHIKLLRPRLDQDIQPSTPICTRIVWRKSRPIRSRLKLLHSCYDVKLSRPRWNETWRDWDIQPSRLRHTKQCH